MLHIQVHPLLEPAPTPANVFAFIYGNSLRKGSRLPASAVQRSKKIFMAATPDLKDALVSRKKFSTFTNKEGRVLTQYSEKVWGAERPFVWFGLDVNGRGAVIKLSDGSLWVHSPVGLDPELKRAVDALGKVKHIVTPNFEHNKFAGEWLDAYPDAKGYVVPGGKKKYPNVRYSQELSENNEAPPEWLGEIEPTFLSYEAVPVLNIPFFNEVVFVHKPSGTLIATDLIWNYPKTGTNRGTQAWKFGMDRVYKPFYTKFMIKDKGAYKGATHRLLETLPWEAIVPCHGDYIPSGGKQILTKHLGLNR